MTTTIKVLKRRDASSVVVAIVIAFILISLLPTMTAELASKISGLDDGQSLSLTSPGGGWQEQYLQPVVWAALQLVLLEIILWLWAALKSGMPNK